jgi:twinfilin-like protein
VKIAQSSVAIAVDTKHPTMTGIQFPLTNAVETAVRELSCGAVDCVQMSIDTKKEIINLEEKSKCPRGIVDLAKKVPSDQPRYHLYVFPHAHEGDHLKSIGT